MADGIREINSPSVPLFQRSVSLPLRPSDTRETRRESSNTDPQVKTLFGHSSARIVSFTTSFSSNSIKTSISDREEEVGTLQWTSRVERVLAVGPLRIYRAPGSITFLSCGTVLKPIFPKTRCWCVDDDSSKIVMQMRKPEYWRIEIIGLQSNDPQVTSELKDVLSQISLFERTPCPFQRSFTIDLPAPPSTPVKRRPWRPVQTPKRHIGATQSPDVTPDLMSAEEANSVEVEDISEQKAGSDSDATDDTNITPRNPCPRSVVQPTLYADENKTPLVFQAGRSITAPPQLTLVTSPPSKMIRESSPLRRSVSRDSASSDISSSDADSFHTVQSWHSPITPPPPSPPESNPASPTMYPYPHENITLPKRPHHNRDISELTVTLGTPQIWDIPGNLSTDYVLDEIEVYTTLPAPSTPTLIDDIEDNLDEEHFEIATPPAVTRRIRHRATTSSNSNRRALSPLPAAANIFSPRRRPRRLQTARHIPTAIIQKTCEILLSPPSHLLHLMLDIAAKIRAGEWRGVVFGYGEGGEKIVGQWDYDDGDVVGDGWGEDDYGAPLGGKQATKRNCTTPSSFGGSWEID